MPYKREGKTIYHLKGGHWSVKQHCTSIENAKTTLRLLKELEVKKK